MEFVPTQIHLGGMKINNTDHSSTISIGSAFKVNRSVSAKKTQGIGQQLADRTIRISTVSMVLDNDLLEGISQKGNK